MNRATFLAAVRHTLFGGMLSQSQVDGMDAILAEWDRRAASDLRWLAYILATTLHETGGTMQPVREQGRGRGTRYGTTYYGRGFVQLTWEANYRKASAIVGVDLVADPDRALELPIATAILFDGMIRGWFTGRKLADYINDRTCDYRGARQIVNGTDRADAIAGHASRFEVALIAASAMSLPRETPGRPDDPGAPPLARRPAARGGFLVALLNLIAAAIAALTRKGN